MPPVGFGGEKAVAVAGGQRVHDRLLRHVGLEQHAAGPLGPPGAAGDLMEKLIGPLAGPQIAAGHPEIGIDHPDQRQHREVVALGDDLGADQHVVSMRLDAATISGWRAARSADR